MQQSYRSKREKTKRRVTSVLSRFARLVLFPLLNVGCHEIWRGHTDANSDSTPANPPCFSDVDRPTQRYFHILEDIESRDLSVALDGSIYLIGMRL